MMLAPWQEEAWRLLVARRARGTMPHAILLCGAAGLGQREFAERCAAWLLCEQPDEAACGTCRSCRLYAVRTQRDPEETRPDGSPAQPSGHPNHPDARFVGYVWNPKASPKKMYAELVIEQIRELSEWLALPPQFGRAQVALIEPADALNVAAANALLKTLEEPGAGRHLILVATQPARLPATIRSRCQRVELHTPERAVAEAWLRQRGVTDAAARQALDASDGNPGQVLAWIETDRLKLCQDVARDLRELNAGISLPFEVAQRWSRDESDLRLHFAAALTRQQARAQARVASAHAGGPLALTRPVDLAKLAIWFDRANRARDLLRGPIRPDLAMLELLTAWSAASGQTATFNEGVE
ncbi:MAG: DNA polymerase III subunit delta' [Proteobacteria bacterium]|uniref:DNA polymerase III subunit delta' n=1 Tax=Rudaea sp. TaxID=2136325 RepID=UPI001D779A03|nr:DNA polymerase III subunit delta' [Pseudomonadota bacterium]MBS0567208.1 DNA polymerase III subunit delta' [Pseudomonadota bacterium]